MRVGLLAPEYSGKTSYLVALYAVLTQDKNGLPDYPVRFDVKDPAQRMWFNESFQNLIDEERPKEERFPQKTINNVTEYVVSVTDKSKKKVSHDITIVDFPGELLRGAKTDAAVGLHTKVIKSLSSCDAFIVVLDAEYLVEKNNYRSKSKLSPDDISKLLLDTLETSKDSFSYFGVPVVFCVSKLDLLGTLKRDQTETIERAYRKIIGLFPTFFEASHRHPVMIAGISLGEEIGGKVEDRKDMTKPGGPFEPFFIETPLEFCLSFCSFSASKYNEEKELEWEQERNSNQYKLEKAKRMGFWDTVVEWFETPAVIGESPSEYHSKKTKESEDIMDAYKRESKNYHKIGYSVTSAINKYNELCSYVVYYSGKKHKFKKEPRRGEFPLEIS